MNLTFVPEEEFPRVLALPEPLEVRSKIFATACRINTLYSIMRAGSGHIGSSFSAMDIIVWLHLKVLPSISHGVYFSSKGHDAPGLYAIMSGLGKLPFDKLHALRRLGGLPGHPDIGTDGIPCNTGSLGMGISKAKGMIEAARLERRPSAVFVLTGDGELQEGQIWESLQGAANRRMGELTVIVDHNKIQSDTWLESVSPLGDLAAKFLAFGWEVARCNGHNFCDLEEIFQAFSHVQDRPKILIADTIKGRGISFMEKTSTAGLFELYKFHSGAPSMDQFAAGVAELRAEADAALGSHGPLRVVELDLPDRKKPSGQRLVTAYGSALVEQAHKNPDLVALDADLMLDCGLIPFAEEFQDRFIECGIAEQDMVSQAGGLALAGKLPVVHSFACFLTPRANEQIYNNATERTKIIYTGSLAGVLPASPGHSHQSVRDIALLAQIPGLTLIQPSCEQEVRAALDWAVNGNPSSTYIRLTSVPLDIPFGSPDAPLLRGIGSVLREGCDLAIMGYGPVLLTQAWLAAEILAHDSISAKVLNLPWLNCADPAWLRQALEGINVVVFLEDHYAIGGQADMLNRSIVEHKIAVSPLIIGLKDVPACGLQDEVLRKHYLDGESIAAATKRFLARHRI